MTILLACAFLSGCAKIVHMQELLRLDRYSKNSDLKHEYVDTKVAALAVLVRAVKNKEIMEYGDEESFRAQFGDPEFSRVVERDNRTLKQWVYRHPIKYFNTEKVEVYFDESGKRVAYEYFPLGNVK